MSDFDSANETSYFSDWFDGLLEKSADYELIEDQTLQKLRLNSKKVLKNNFLAVTIQQAYVNAILGGEIVIGVLAGDSLKKSVEKFLEKQLKKVDLNREHSFNQINEQIINAAFADGDILINLPIDKYYTGEVKTYVELIEARRIKTPPKYSTNNLVKEGVEYYKSGKLKGYWYIKNSKDREHITYYTANDKDFDFLPAYKKDGIISRRVCWLFKAPLNLRPGQSRQFPVLTGIFWLIRFVNQMLEAVLLGIRVAACFAGFIETDNAAGTRAGTTESDSKDDIKTKGGLLTKMQPAMLAYLKKGQKITFSKPNRPSDNFDPFLLRLCRFISACVRIPYEQIFLDLGITNYSAWRGGSLETERNINRWRRDLKDVDRWILITWLQEAIVRKVIKGSLKDIRLQITFPKYKSLDEEKTARANKIELATESISQKRVQEGKGQDFSELQKEITIEEIIKVEREAKILKRKQELEKELGIEFPENKEKEERETKKRPGETKETKEDDDKERRKEDGNN